VSESRLDITLSHFKAGWTGIFFATLGLALELSELQMCLTDWRGQGRNYNLSTLVNV